MSENLLKKTISNKSKNSRFKEKVLGVSSKLDMRKLKQKLLNDVHISKKTYFGKKENENVNTSKITLCHFT